MTAPDIIKQLVERFEQHRGEGQEGESESDGAPDR
jgi:hypothetical protein